MGIGTRLPRWGIPSPVWTSYLINQTPKFSYNSSKRYMILKRKLSRIKSEASEVNGGRGVALFVVGFVLCGGFFKNSDIIDILYYLLGV